MTHVCCGVFQYFKVSIWNYFLGVKVRLLAHTAFHVSPRSFFPGRHLFLIKDVNILFPFLEGKKQQPFSFSMIFSPFDFFFIFSTRCFLPEILVISGHLFIFKHITKLICKYMKPDCRYEERWSTRRFSRTPKS